MQAGILSFAGEPIKCTNLQGNKQFVFQSMYRNAQYFARAIYALKRAFSYITNNIGLSRPSVTLSWILILKHVAYFIMKQLKVFTRNIC